MSLFSAEQVVSVAQVAHIALTDDEAARFAAELEDISSLIAKVAEIGRDDVPPTSHPIPLINVMRGDVAGPTLDVDEILAAAPAAEDDQFQVPQILGED